MFPRCLSNIFFFFLHPCTAAPMPLHQKEPRYQEVMAVPLSHCPNFGIHPMSCWGTMASLNRDTTSTADGALMVQRPLKTSTNTASKYSSALVHHHVLQALRKKYRKQDEMVTFSVSCSWIFPFRAKTVGDRAISGDEHSVQVLVLLPQGQLQQEDVWGVQTVCCRRCQRQLQVRRTFKSWALRLCPRDKK